MLMLMRNILLYVLAYTRESHIQVATGASSGVNSRVWWRLVDQIPHVT